MKGKVQKALCFSWLLSIVLLSTGTVFADSENIPEIPVKGMVTMVDLGANSCIPCKMMAPIRKKLQMEYEGKAAIVFIDVLKDKKPAQRFKIKTIPTQIFFDQDGNEVYRHSGFMSERAIVTQLNNLGAY